MPKLNDEQRQETKQIFEDLLKEKIELLKNIAKRILILFGGVNFVTLGGALIYVFFFLPNEAARIAIEKQQGLSRNMEQLGHGISSMEGRLESEKERVVRLLAGIAKIEEQVNHLDTNKVIRVVTASEELSRHPKVEELLQLNINLSTLQDNLKKVEEFIEQEKKAVQITFHGNVSGQTSQGTCPDPTHWQSMGQVYWFRDDTKGAQFYSGVSSNFPGISWTHAEVCKRK